MTLGHLGHAVVVTARICAPTIVQAAVGTLTAEVCDRRLDYWSNAVLQHAHVDLTVVGREHLPPGETFVVMSNHQSYYDIPVLFRALQLRVRMVAKKELFYIPLFSHAMRIAGFVELDRANRERAIHSLKAAEKALASGTNIWIAPEGTRSPTGKLGSFKKGGFQMALATGARILPVTIVGTRDALLAKGYRVHNGARVRVTIGPPIDPKQYGRERRDDLVEAVRHAIAQHLP
jgi:1-acyl-sn-glycerol-3-phosphate acyltransferase